MRSRSPLLIAAATVDVLVAALLVTSTTAWGTDEPRRAGCTITGTNFHDELYGTSGSDVICARGGFDLVLGRGGDDVIYGGRGRDSLEGGAGDDRVYGGAGHDEVLGRDGDDRLFGQGGPDIVIGGRGADLHFGGIARDWLVADDGMGNDRLSGGAGGDEYCADPGDMLRSVETMSCPGD